MSKTTDLQEQLILLDHLLTPNELEQYEHIQRAILTPDEFLLFDKLPIDIKINILDKMRPEDFLRVCSASKKIFAMCKFYSPLKEKLLRYTKSYQSILKVSLLKLKPSDFSMYEKNRRYGDNRIVIPALRFFQKYNNLCVPFTEFYDHIVWDVTKQVLSFTPNIYNIKWCIHDSKKRFTAFSLVIKSESDTHMNILLYDKLTNTIEHFEPHGYATDVNVSLREMYDNILYYFRRIVGESVTLVEQTMLCPKIGFQQIQERMKEYYGHTYDPSIGFCLAWTLYYLHNRLIYPDVPPNLLIKELIQKFKISKIDMTRFIQDYVAFLYGSISQREINLLI